MTSFFGVAPRDSILDCAVCAQPARNVPISIATGVCMNCLEVATRRLPQQKRADQ